MSVHGLTYYEHTCDIHCSDQIKKSEYQEQWSARCDIGRLVASRSSVDALSSYLGEDCSCVRKEDGTEGLVGHTRKHMNGEINTNRRAQRTQKAQK